MCSVIRLFDQRGVDMDAALELVRAGPAPGPLVLAGRDRAGARHAADRRVAAIVERVVRDLVDVDVGLDALGVPVDERLDLPDAVPLRPLHLLRVRPRRALLAPDAGDPGAVRGERAFERLDLPDVATAVGVGRPEAVGRIDRPERPQLEAVTVDEPVA